MRTFAIRRGFIGNPPKEDLPYLAVIIAPNGAVAGWWYSLVEKIGGGYLLLRPNVCDVRQTNEGKYY
jgi:hypothetical protein